MDKILKQLKKYEDVTLGKKSPIEIHNMGRNCLAKVFGELEYTSGAEIGVCKGKYSEILCKANPKLYLYCIDSWKAYKEYQEDYTQQMMEQLYEESKGRLAPYNCEIIRKYSMDAVKDFKDESLDFVFIDGSHEFQQVTNDIAEWSKKVRKGGIVSGHDFTRYKRKPLVCHVKNVVQGWTYSYKINPWFVLRKQHGSTWFWIKDVKTVTE